MSVGLKPAIFGEVLFDCFPDGSAVLGGAPFNVAWHLQGFAMAPVMLSAVGKDEHGEQVLQTMQQWGMDMSGMQVTPDYPTGQVTVSIENNEPSYEIVPDQAYDHLDLDAMHKVLGSQPFAVLYHGTLAARTTRSKDNLDQLISQYKTPTFVDVNLRDPWWERHQVIEAISNARWVKLNQDELATVTQNTVDTETQLREAAQALLREHQLELLIITLGEHGAMCLTTQSVVRGEPVPVKQLVDTVGAGDSFSAVMITGIMKRWPLQQTLDRALSFASAVCEQRGATTSDNSLYRRFLNQWGD